MAYVVRRLRDGKFFTPRGVEILDERGSEGPWKSAYTANPFKAAQFQDRDEAQGYCYTDGHMENCLEEIVELEALLMTEWDTYRKYLTQRRSNA